MKVIDPPLPKHNVVSRSQWDEARRAFLAKEKAFTRQHDELSRERRQLPWVKVEKDYKFETHEGQKTLAELFDGRSQLFVYHFMLGPDWDAGCPGCSFLCDHLDGANRHLAHHDVSVVVEARAPLPKLDAYKQRMEWRFRWASSGDSDFRCDFHVSATPAELKAGKMTYNFDPNAPAMDEVHGLSVFYKDEHGDVFHTYSAYARGCEPLVGTYGILDLMPKGRNERGPRQDMGDWMRRHDEYADA